MTASPTIGPFIKEVVYDNSWLDRPIDPTPRNNRSYKGSRVDYAIAELFREQEHIRTYELAPCLAQAFENLPNVRRVVLQDLSRTAGLPGDSPDCEGKPLSYRVIHGDFTRHTGVCIDGRKSQCDDSCRWQYRGILVLFTALSVSTPPRLDELCLGDGRNAKLKYSRNHSIDLGSGLPYWYFTRKKTCFTDESCSPIFQRLRKLQLSICFPELPRAYWANQRHYPDASDENFEELRTLLSKAENLEDLMLCGQVDVNYLVVSKILGLNTWQKLRALSLRSFTVTYDELIDLLGRHKSSLKTIHLENFNLEKGTWCSFDERISVEMPSLAVIPGFLWENRDWVETPDDEEDADWLPTEDLEDYPECYFSEDEAGYSTGSEAWDHDEIDVDGLKKSAQTDL